MGPIILQYWILASQPFLLKQKVLGFTWSISLIFAKSYLPLQVDVNAWLEAFSAHPPIGKSASPAHIKSQTSAQFSFLNLLNSLSYSFILYTPVSCNFREYSGLVCINLSEEYCLFVRMLV